ncbi:adhesin-like protein [Candida orthopsilosis Co 90-125]|uniref:Adhesin-like protein n=1 Tax=Candida orthopsilosis (strain 90-125) TaxID=1136231 RepID=H8X0D1_CANO9|nr:adhesin-like protein [Candida orthopsilosis Co 90-125]CCG22643.1 adhesin-like protein [Candida orthopsilosis Co 90-125]
MKENFRQSIATKSLSTYIYRNSMPTIKDLDQFFELSTDLVANFPSTTLSITYSNTAKKLSSKASKSTTTDESSSTTKHKPPTHTINIKLFEPHTGKCLKYKTTKQKEFSRVLNVLGPQGVNSNGLGLASLMSNQKYVPEPVVEESKKDAGADDAVLTKENTPVVEESTTATGGSKKKNKKKKKKN